MKGTNWTPEEDNRLLDLVNQYKSKTGRGIRWERIPMGKFWRTPDALKNRWNHDLKHRTDMVDGTWVLNQMQLQMEPSKVKVVHETPLKVKKLKKSFLWGLYTVEREE
jgi:hypothetical protein